MNLATHLVRDAFLRRFDVAVVVSNDSDLYEPIRVVRQELGKPVGILIPEERRPSAKLEPIASFVRSIRRAALAKSQFPEELVDAVGTFRKPASWQEKQRPPHRRPRDLPPKRQGG